MSSCPSGETNRHPPRPLATLSPTPRANKKAITPETFVTVGGGLSSSVSRTMAVTFFAATLRTNLLLDGGRPTRGWPYINHGRGGRGS